MESYEICSSYYPSSTSIVKQVSIANVDDENYSESDDDIEWCRVAELSRSSSSIPLFSQSPSAEISRLHDTTQTLPAVPSTDPGQATDTVGCEASEEDGMCDMYTTGTCTDF